MSSKVKTSEKRGDSKNSVARLLFVLVALIIQFIWFMYVVVRISGKYSWISGLISVLAAVIVIAIYNSEEIANIKLPWTILILMFPLPGLVLYFMVHLSGTTRYVKKRLRLSVEKCSSHLIRNMDTEKDLYEIDKGIYNISNYIQRYSNYPVYVNTDVEYFADTKLALKSLIEKLKSAKDFIFMCYFAIQDASVFSEIYEVLVQKVSEGVEVRIFYDDIGSVGFLDDRYFIKKLKEAGMDCRVFNPVIPIFSLLYNNRDHRKITVIDGKTAFTGGYNIADKYFNIVKPYGEWKDSGVMLEGEAVRSLTAIFLENWNAADRKLDIAKINDSKYFPRFKYEAGEKVFIHAYADSPLEKEELAENVYISIISQAKDYVYIMTPYLIITDAMKHALTMAAKRGVDVRIVTPGIPDKRIIYRLTRSFYSVLVKVGVKIYEYTPGFCHAKQMVSDDKIAVCGTINFDYRSLYLNFENAVMFTDSKALRDMKEDFFATFKISNHVSRKYANLSAPKTAFDAILRLFALLL